jgi:acetyl-CoA synthetase
MERFEIVWEPDPSWATASNTGRFMRRHGIADYATLYARSVSEPEWFWWQVVEFLGLPFDQEPTIIRDTSRGHEWATWFVDGRFNLVNACVDRWARETPQRVAVRSLAEGGAVEELDFSTLANEVERLAGALQGLGVGRGDAVAVYLPMSSVAVIAFLAIARVGAIFIPLFSGFGAEALASRIRDPVPSALICSNGFTRRGRVVETKEIVDTALGLLGVSVPTVVVNYIDRAETPMTEGRDRWWEEITASAPTTEPMITFPEDPVMIAYTSGTTGRPKGAVHVHAGLTVKVAAEGAFQMELTPDDVLMWVTDMGWIMGPWMVLAGLANGATIALFDGAPDYPGPDRVWEAAASMGVTALGISPTLVRSLQPHGAEPVAKHDLSRLRVFGSTGEPWNPEPWWWLFETVGKQRIPIVNISGGTEIGACILSVNLLQGVKPTSLGGPALGVDADVYDRDGRPLVGEVGELVVRGSWPGMTRGFWGEPERYLETYWSRFENTWVHGDWASIDEDGFWYLHGRSDDTLNVAGKRIGPAEIESVVVAMPEVTMAAAVGLPHDVKGETVGLYVVAAPGVKVGNDLTRKVDQVVSDTLGKAFHPETIVWVDDLPRTRSQKIMRRVVKAMALGTDPGDLTSLENPESLDQLRAVT